MLGQGEISLDDLKNLIVALGFTLQDGQKGLWTKKYRNLNGYVIRIHLDKPKLKECRVDYGTEIKTGRTTTCNFSQPESIVVLECVNRLLEKGYEPNKIVLEKDWPLGHKGKGFLDILVLDSEGKSFLMIECKTFGEEHRKEKEKMFLDGGQLFSYLIQEKSTRYLCLYSSHFDNGEIEFENEIVVVDDRIRSAKNQQESFESWNQIFENKGLFESDIQPYLVKFGGILKKDLRELKAEEGGFIFNRFEEILRRNVVSDKTNAFNKIFNLFLCKIVDEYEHSDDEKLSFQWEEGETNEKVLLRLNDLYKRGMDIYLGLKIAAVTEDELERELDKVGTQAGKATIRELFIQQKLYTGNEFAFKEVFDKKSFEENSIVVKEVVKLLEKYRIKYTSKQQFLGDFFEKLLNTGIKQEVGQFFTPIPITRFICKSIPIGEIISDKNDNKEENFLPYVIDYASGSGHFLTEIMDEINGYVRKIDDSWIKGGGLARKIFNASKGEYLWAKEYVYGIEKDYRLAKTTKISTFLNGDGDANVICGDGLDSFSTSSEYTGKLKIKNDDKNNAQFDILVANPPYSVSGFKNSLKNGKESFTLYDRVTEQSSEIECFFVERAKQLVKPGGYAGIILPVSLLSNGGVYTAARELLLKYFDIKGIVEFGSNTFMATGTNTITLFLKRKDDHFAEKITSIVDKFLSDYRDVTCSGIEDAFSQYVKVNYKDISFGEFVNLLQGKHAGNVLTSEVYQEYIRGFEKDSGTKRMKKTNEFATLSDAEKEERTLVRFVEFIRKMEKEKMLYFMLTYKKHLVLVKSGAKNVEKRFLGYEFSNRRGYEGIRLYKESSLYDDTDLLNPSRVNTYILKNCLEEPLPEIPDPLKEHMQFVSLHELIDFERSNFEKKISTAFRKNIQIKSSFPLAPLSTLVAEGKITYVSGLVYEKTDEVVTKTQNRVLTASNINLDTGHLDLSETLFLREDLKIDLEKQLKTDDIFICTASGSISHLGKNCLIEKTPGAYFGGFCGVLRSGDKNLIHYLHLVLNTEEFRNYVQMQRGQNINNLTRDYLLNFKIPIPTTEKIKKVLGDIKKLNKVESDALEELTKVDNQSVALLKSISTGSGTPIGRDFQFEYGKGLPERDRVAGGYPVVGSNGVVGYHNVALIKGPAIVVGRKGSVGKVNYIKDDCFPIDTTFYVSFDETKFKPKYVYYVLKSANLDQLNSGIGPGGLNREDAYNVRVPLISPKEQERLLEKIAPLENRVDELQMTLLNLRLQKREVLDRYLL